MKDLKNKVVWITGASSGIGEALAIVFAKQGAILVLSARRISELERVKKACGLGEERVLILPLDLEKSNEFDIAVQQVLKRFDRIDVLVNNGGISQRSLASETPVAIDRKIMEVNYFGTIALTKLVLPVMQRQRSGHIVVMSSVSGKYGFHLRSAYAASKHALHGFFESLRLEEEKNNIHVTLVCPGKIKTNISINAITKTGDKHNVMDQSQAQGMLAGVCAEHIIKAIQKQKLEVFMGGKEVFGVWVKRFFPFLFYRILQKQKVQ